MNLVFIAKWENVPQLETCVKSIAYYNSDVNYYVLNADIAQEWFFHLNQLLKPFNSRVIDTKIPSDQLATQLPVQIKLSQTKQLAHLDKALFLSLETLVTGNLASLYHYQLGEKLWALSPKQQAILINLQAVRQNAFLQENQLGPDSLTSSLMDKLTELGRDLPTKFISDSGDSVVQLLDQPWKDEINDHNQLWWPFFATDWPVIQKRELLVPAQTLENSTPKTADKDNRMQFIMAANYNYQPAFLTTIKSLLFHNQNVDIHLINPDIPQTWFNAINHQIWPSRLIDVKISPDMLNVKDVKTYSSDKLGHVNNMTNALLYLHELIKCPRALYLDSDVIVKRNLRAFYDLDLKGHPFAASRELFNYPMINVGVMLLDLDRLRQIPQLSAKMVDYYQHHDVSTASESIISHFFLNQYLELSFTYDYQIGSEKEWEQAYDFNQMDRHFEQCYCLHYVTGDKPWKTVSITRHRQLWWSYFDLSWLAIRHQRSLPLKTRFNSSQRVMICTGAEKLEHFEQIVTALPEIEFYVTAHTPVSWTLMKMIQYPNVHIYPEVRMPVHKRISQISSVILDIGYGDKDNQLMLDALNDGKFVLSFNTTQASSKLTSYPNYLVFDYDQVQDFIDTLHYLVSYGDLSN